MSPVERALLRFVGLYAIVAGVELLERVAYRAGVAAVVDEDLADELEPVDVTDVVWLHLARHADGNEPCGCAEVLLP